MQTIVHEDDTLSAVEHPGLEDEDLSLGVACVLNAV
jgi:hypothetical protein